MRPAEVSANQPARALPGALSRSSARHARGRHPTGVDQSTRAMTKGLRPVVTVGTLSGVSDPSAPMANCDTVLSLVFVT